MGFQRFLHWLYSKKIKKLIVSFYSPFFENGPRTEHFANLGPATLLKSGIQITAKVFMYLNPEDSIKGIKERAIS
jgi:hypothetical protein